jgi:Hemerythrin HHE cation binding domain
MKPARVDVAEVGELLLEQHAGLRARTARCLELSQRLLRGEAVAPQLATEIVRLREAFTDHNDTEEQMLEPFLAASDAWGPLRVDRMLEEHAAEHTAFFAALEGSTAEIAARFADFAEEIDAHMAAEERTFLSPRVLEDARNAARQRR